MTDAEAASAAVVIARLGQALTATEAALARVAAERDQARAQVAELLAEGFEEALARAGNG